MMTEIIQKDNEREKYIRELKCKLEHSETRILTNQNKYLKDLMNAMNT